jgi:hypothetical protein
MDRNAQIERAWQLMLGARNDLLHAQKALTQKAEQFERANKALMALLNGLNENDVANILEKQDVAA